MTDRTRRGRRRPNAADVAVSRLARALAVVGAACACACGHTAGADAAARRVWAEDTARAAAAENIPDTCGVRTAYAFTESGVGALQVGRPLADVRRECIVVSDDTTGEGMDDAPRRMLVVRTPHGDAELLTDDSAHVSSVIVKVATLRTSDSLGVGTTLGRLLRIPGTKGEQDEDGLFVVPGSRCGLMFRMNYREPTISLGHLWSTSELSRLPSDIRVREMGANAGPCPRRRSGDDVGDAADRDPPE